LRKSQHRRRLHNPRQWHNSQYSSVWWWLSQFEFSTHFSPTRIRTEPDYMAANFGYVKIKTDRKDASVYIDGGFADKVEKAKKFALRPGNHDIELRDSDGRTLYREKVAVTIGKTTELRAG